MKSLVSRRNDAYATFQSLAISGIDPATAFHLLGITRLAWDALTCVRLCHRVNSSDSLAYATDWLSGALSNLEFTTLVDIFARNLDDSDDDFEDCDTCEDSDHTCEDSDHTCEDSDHTCDDFDTCDDLGDTCDDPLESIYSKYEYGDDGSILLFVRGFLALDSRN